MPASPAQPNVKVLEGMRNIVVRGVNWLGDAVMTTPALTRLREAAPAARITLLTHEKLADLWLNHPALDQIIAFRQGESVWSVGRRLRRESFDTALLLPNSPRSALEAWLAGIPRRIGLRQRWRSCLLTQAVAPPTGIKLMRKRTPGEVRTLLKTPGPATQYPGGSHHLHQYLHLVGALGGSTALAPTTIVLTPAEKGADTLARLFRRALGASASPDGVWLGLNVGAEYGPAKRWPADRFAHVANEISGRRPCRWMLFGGPKERALAEELLKAVPTAASLCGQTTLRELMIGLAHCRLLLTNDSGPMHLAAALGTSVVALFGSTSPELTGPGLPGDPRHKLLRHPAPCAPCFLRECPADFRCMLGLAEDAVVEAVTQQLDCVSA